MSNSSSFDIDKASAELVAAIKQTRGETTMSNRDTFVVFNLPSGNGFAIRASNVIAVLEKQEPEGAKLCQVSYYTGRDTDPVSTVLVTDKMIDIVSTINSKTAS